MAWDVKDETRLSMVEGDYGVGLPVDITGTTFTVNDEVNLVIKAAINGETIIEKTFSSIENNTINLVLTEAESALLPVGNYVYSLDWYQSGAFMCNIIPWASFKVVEKA